MSSLPRRLLLTAGTLAAFGAGAAPALAANSTPLQSYLAKATPQLRQNVGGVGSRAEELRTIRTLTAGEHADLAAIHHVEGLPTLPDQMLGKKRWLEGQRYQMRGDAGTIAGLRLVLAGHRTAGAAEVNRQWAPQENFFESDHWNAIGLRYLHVTVN